MMWKKRVVIYINFTPEYGIARFHESEIHLQVFMGREREKEKETKARLMGVVVCCVVVRGEREERKIGGNRKLSD